MSTAQLRVIGGRLLVVVDAEYAQQLHVLLDRALAAACATGQPLLPAMHEVSEAARRAAALYAFGIVPLGGHSRDVGSADPGEWISTAEMARHLGISHDAVRKRVARGVMRSRLVAGRRVVPLNGGDRCRTE